MKNLLSHVYKHEERTNNTHIEPCSVEKEKSFRAKCVTELKARLQRVDLK